GEKRDFRRRDSPQIGILFAEPIEQQGCSQSLSNQPRLEIWYRIGNFRVDPKPFSEGLCAAYLSHLHCFHCPARSDQEFDVVVVKRNRVRQERQSQLFAFDLRSRSCDRSDRSSKLPIGLAALTFRGINNSKPRLCFPTERRRGVGIADDGLKYFF